MTKHVYFSNFERFTPSFSFAASSPAVLLGTTFGSGLLEGTPGHAGANYADCAMLRRTRTALRKNHATHQGPAAAPTVAGIAPEGTTCSTKHP